ncbi:MAG: DUF507 family protein [Nitrospira sp.]|nr:DUF507 family protein [Nitrospira sp.]MCP9465594.1 DUF507 family protein [Nitrospira sp.]
MRLSKERVRHIAEQVVGHLEEAGDIALAGDRRSLVDALDRAITDELSVEDRLNAEVRRILATYEKQIEEGQVDYQKMFHLIKQKLIRERGLVL